MEKSDIEKEMTPPDLKTNNPLYCSYVDGQFTYKDPHTSQSFIWNETDKKWVGKDPDNSSVEEPGLASPGTSQVHFDGESYTYTDQDGVSFLWDSSKAAWFPKELENNGAGSWRLPPSPPDLSCTSNQTLGYFNPNYKSSMVSPNQETSRRFYYASLSPTTMGVCDQPGLFLSPDDQVNNNDQVEDVLPSGWEKHEDGNGPYYWHIKSGTIQREYPVNSPVNNPITANPALMIPGTLDGISGFRRSNTVCGVANVANDFKRRSWVNYLEDNKVANKVPPYEFDKQSFKFAAISLGCLAIEEDDLTPERSSRAVSKVIAELTNPNFKADHHKHPSELASRMWVHTEGTLNMYLELTDSHLRVKVHRDVPLTILEQPIHSIRVWGVGREDPRDFAFVAREKSTRQFLCHVFRLEMYARPLASSLRDACKKIMIERNSRVNKSRPTTLGLKKNCNNKLVTNNLFPTPMDEPRKVIKAFYLGSKSVNKPTGIEVLNNAIEGFSFQNKIPVLVSVAPSVIGITGEDGGKLDIEVRVRFLSFMGIGSDIKTCGIIIHTARDDFEAHCFYCTPSTGALCKAIEAACVLRYQKCLDAHHTSDYHKHGDTTSGSCSPKSGGASATASNLASALKTVFSSFGKAKSEEK